MYRTLLPVVSLAATVLAQQPGPYTPEVHPKLSSQVCTRAGGCKNVSSAVVLDSAYRWLHTVDGYDACQNNGQFNTTICPDVETCAKSCAIEGADYESSGVHTSGNSITLNLFVNGASPSPRVYLLSANESRYEMFKLLNREFTFDVDTSKVPCGYVCDSTCSPRPSLYLVLLSAIPC
jgi:cellulose 1,4-beta-cellobiosidase